MFWLKLFLGYCVLVALGMWFGYRSHQTRLSRVSRDASGLEVPGTENPVETGTGSAPGL